MFLTMWILFIVFGIYSLWFGIGMLFTGANWVQAIFIVFSIFVTAICAGYLFGGLKLPF